MAAGQPTILATSGGYKPGERTRIEFNHLMHYAVELSGVTGRAPKVTHIGTASGDQRWWAAEMDQAARIAGFDFSHLNLFTMPNIEDPEAHLLEQDVVWVNGGSVVNLLAVWRAHGLDRILRKAWEGGVGLVYRGTELVEVVSEIKNKAAFRVTPGAGESVDAVAVEERLESRFLG
ncbi:Type 1 glutamine amidotransferase-like domain-containing protein [Paenarthrobacter nitroguajacolicus]|uniref:Type 1 glutamine amidotransferase-like domain-containing protein n=1 Tax=Paenarthrobacter nitroguajacolicus TaxID=211146 RepID=UPI00248CCEFB|nr:Type 1 glutamine amidotransferase-like domain-containing protein [Paenarthrobacter nitroguajacolicus]MDI2035130.1 hypothetical protein [Paenarthrobacter nitroguajacolicus]